MVDLISELKIKVMAKIDDIGMEKFPKTGTITDWNAEKTAYLKGVNDTLIALTNQIGSKVPESLQEFLDRILKFIEGYYE